MLIRLSDALTAGKPLTIRKHAANGKNSRDASLLGAFSVEETLTWTVTPSREYGVQSVVLQIAADGEAPRDFPFTWQEDGAFSLTLPIGVLCENIDNCLFAFVYKYVFVFGCVCKQVRMCVGACMSWCPYRGQRITCGSWFSPSTMWVLGIKLRLGSKCFSC